MKSSQVRATLTVDKRKEGEDGGEVVGGKVEAGKGDPKGKKMTASSSPKGGKGQDQLKEGIRRFFQRHQTGGPAYRKNQRGEGGADPYRREEQNKTGTMSSQKTTEKKTSGTKGRFHERGGKKKNCEPFQRKRGAGGIWFEPERIGERRKNYRWGEGGVQKKREKDRHGKTPERQKTLLTGTRLTRENTSTSLTQESVRRKTGKKANSKRVLNDNQYQRWTQRACWRKRGVGPPPLRKRKGGEGNNRTRAPEPRRCLVNKNKVR